MNKNEENILKEKIPNLLINSKTDDGTFYSALYDLYFFIEVSKGIKDINDNKGMSLEESRERMMRKYENYNTKYGS